MILARGHAADAADRALARLLDERQPLPGRRAARGDGIPLLVDGAQSAGAIALDATPFDFYTFSGQKWLCGPDATGALVVRDPERCTVTAPSYLSQAGYEPTGDFMPRAGAARFDSAGRRCRRSPACWPRSTRRPRGASSARASWPRAAASCSAERSTS